VIAIDDRRLIEVQEQLPPARPAVEPGAEERAQAQSEIAYAQQLKEQIIKDAEQFAQSLIAKAQDEARKMLDAARAEIDEWWQEKRAQDEEVTEQAKRQGMDQGYREGWNQAEAEVAEKYRQMLDEARRILQEAEEQKLRTIFEAEPFLIELSCAIAEKIIGRQLSLSREWIVDMIRKALERKREKGVITICVAPRNFSFVQDWKEELLSCLDSQAELSIVPDVTVKDDGCVIRSAFGSLDARIGTQLTEIKHALQQLAEKDGESVLHGEYVEPA
jgi:flagellar assembly protein FliH